MAIRPMLARGGRLVLMSPPFGKRGPWEKSGVKGKLGSSQYRLPVFRAHLREFLEEGGVLWATGGLAKSIT